ncbi:FliG C-terminal domain-containing protein [Thalassomonas actiniarum]|uniref:Flagellar motor switch protein FliG n=1 Tax=Thalassomonas actiniarum TaxID=485447 RepID=A0AAE9YQS1_9GAMM|nr:FliG C-terminal domain-containing protein [Thalassomonas actiniarum]WDD99345.1 flagellar motor switch protein FliG [Thalassomonas actiniarum]
MSEAQTKMMFNDCEKAAILLLSMGEESAAKILQRMERSEVQSVSNAMARLGNVSTLEAQNILQHFFEQYTKQSGISGASREYLEKSLDMALGNKLARGMLDSIYGDTISNDIQRLQWLPVDVLARFFRHEHPQMQAVMLAFLPPDTANAVLNHLPQESHDELLYRVANLQEISEHVIKDLRITLDRCIDFVAEQSGARVNGTRQAADILNRYSGDKANIMELVKLHNSDTADAIKDNMFDFMILSRQPLEVIQDLIAELPEGMLAIALKGVDFAIKTQIFDALPKRMAQALEDEIQRLGPTPLSKIEQARTEIMAVARRLYEEGELQLQLFEEQVVR